MYHYIPLSTASALFLEVIKFADANREDTSTIDVKQKSDLVTSILVDDSLNIFRRYQVITKKKSIEKVLVNAVGFGGNAVSVLLSL